jgi:hypothetical protein
MLPSAQERRQLFYWLKRISSYTAWSRILSYYQAWAKVTEKSVQAASERGWLQVYGKAGYPISGVRTGKYLYDGGTGERYEEFLGSQISETGLVHILKALAHAEEGVRRLRLGDKRVFQYNAHGEFVIAYRDPSYWVALLNRIEIGENTIDQEHTPHWDEFCFALMQLSDAWAECSPDVIEPRRLDAASYTFFNDYLKAELQAMVFPTPLPDVPDPIEHTLVASGATTPYSGIWEPVDVPKRKGLQLFTKPSPPEGPLALAGTMAYLHAGSPAPNCAAYGKAQGTPTTWRLLWRDDRYEDGSIPEEESGYVFQQPDPTRVAPEPEELRGGLRVWSDEPCPYPGVWQCLDDLTLGPQTVAFSVPMPRLQGRRVLWRLMRGV